MSSLLGGRFSTAQRKFAAWSTLPLPTYCATCG